MHPRSLSLSYGYSISIVYIVIADVFMGLATLAVGIRLWSRKIQRQRLVLNDYTAILGWVFTAGLVITSNIEFARWEDNLSLVSINPADLSKINKVDIANSIGWAAANTSIKISIVHFYITIFRSNRTFLKIAYAVLALLSAFGVAVAITYLLASRPFGVASFPLQFGLLFGVPSGNMTIDIIIIILPMPMIWGLQMARRRKIELTIIFALGSIVCISTIIRLVSSTQDEKFYDYTYIVTRISVPTVLEPLLGITIACLPLFPAAIKKVTGRANEKTNPQTRNVLSGSIARMRLKRSMKSSTLQASSDDSFPLTDLDLEAKGNQTHIADPTSGKDGYVFGAFSDHSAGVVMPPQSSSIMVEHDLEVRSDEVK